MSTTRPIRHLTYRNGTTVVYIVVLVNSFLQVLIAFGVKIDEGQNAALTAFVNAGLLVLARLLGLPYVPVEGTVPCDPVSVVIPSAPPVVLSVPPEPAAAPEPVPLVTPVGP